jgi:carbamoyl-phosphate synthase large subunit
MPLRSDKTRTVLITGAGAPGIRGTLYALHRNPDSARVRTVGTDMQSDVVGRFLVDRFFQVPAPEDPAYPEVLLSICDGEGVEIVLPQTTREITILSRCKSEFHRNGIQVMVSDTDAVELSNNKWLLMRRFDDLQLPHPAFHLAATEEQLLRAAERLGYPERPIVVKRPTSSGMRGLRILREDAWDARRFIEEKPSGLEIPLGDLLTMLSRGDQWPELLVTEHLPGPEYSVDAFVGNEAAVAIPRLRKAMRNGITFDSMLEYREDLVRYTLAAAKSIGLQYAFGFQFKLDPEGIPKVLECNPRVQGTMVASTFSGVNVIWLAIKTLLGEPLPELAGELQVARFCRFWGGLGIVDGCVCEI